MELAWEIDQGAASGGSLLRGVPNPIGPGIRLRLMDATRHTLLPRETVHTAFCGIIGLLKSDAHVRFYWDLDLKKLRIDLGAEGFEVSDYRHGVSTLVRSSDCERVMSISGRLAGGLSVAAIGEGDRMPDDAADVMKTMNEASHLVLLEFYDDAMLIVPREESVEHVLGMVKQWSEARGLALQPRLDKRSGDADFS